MTLKKPQKVKADDLTVVVSYIDKQNRLVATANGKCYRFQYGKFQEVQLVDSKEEVK